MNFEKWIPIIAPAPPAVVIALQLYDEIMQIAHPDWWLLGAFAATLGMVGTIGAEMLAYKQALKALAEREIVPFIIALVGALTVSALVVWAVWRTDDSRPLVVSVIVAIVGYSVAASNDYLTQKKSRRQEQSDKSLAQTQALTELEKQRAKIAAADARKAKAESGAAKLLPAQPKVSESFANDWRHVPQAERVKIAQMTTQEIMSAYGVIERTAQNWKKNAQASG